MTKSSEKKLKRDVKKQQAKRREKIRFTRLIRFLQQTMYREK
jgi:hypothetical protein